MLWEEIAVFDTELTIRWKDGYRVLERHIMKQAQARLSVNELIPALVTDFPLDIAFKKEGLVALYIVAEHDMTLKLNDVENPSATLLLKAGLPYVWHEGGYAENPLPGDVTAMYPSNANAEDGELNVEVLYDPTP